MVMSERRGRVTQLRAQDYRANGCKERIVAASGEPADVSHAVRNSTWYIFQSSMDDAIVYMRQYEEADSEEEREVWLNALRDAADNERVWIRI